MRQPLIFLLPPVVYWPSLAVWVPGTGWEDDSRVEFMGGLQRDPQREDLAYFTYRLIALVLPAREGVFCAARGKWVERFGDALAGGLIVAVGLLVMFLGW